MATLATLVVKLVGDIGDFSNKMSKAQNIGASLGKSMTKLGVGLTAGLTAPIIGAGLAAVKMASDLNEATNKVDVVFGESAQAIKDWSKTSATAFGLTRAEALESAGTFGNLFDAMGITNDASIEMSTTLVQLAGDLASFNNLDPTEVLTALRSGITGEVEPMRRLGVNLLESAVAAKALEMGLANTTEELTYQDKVMARYALIMEQTANAQGDFARTADGLANSQRILKAEVGNLAAGFGAELMPVALQVVDWAKNLLAWLNSLNPSTRGLIVQVLALVAALGPVLIIGGMVVSAISAIGAPLLLIAALIAALALAWRNNWGGIRDILLNLWEGTIKPKFIELQNWLKVFLPAAIEVLRQFWENTLKPGLERFFAFITGTVFPLLQTLWEWLKDNLPTAIETLRGFWENTLKPALERVWNWIRGSLFPMLQDWWGWLSEKVPAAIETLRGWWEDTLLPALEDVWGWMNDTLFPFLQEVSEFITNTFSLAVAGLTLAWELMKPVLEDIWEWFKENILPILEDVWDFIVNTLAPAIGDLVDGALTWLTDKLSDLNDWLDKVVGWFWKLIGAVKNYNDTEVENKVPPSGGGGGTGGTTGGTAGTGGRGGRRAGGGTVIAGVPYWVGERGAEWYVPQRNGFIVNNDLVNRALSNLSQSGGAVQKVVNYMVNGTFVAQPEQTVTDKLRVLQLLEA